MVWHYAGAFLSVVAKHGINLILHGHQHDPSYWTLNFNGSSEDESFIVLASGTATKRLQHVANGAYSKQCQFNIVELLPNKGTIVTGYNYHDVDRAFYSSKIIANRTASKLTR